ncbi:unnamed protein product [Mucor hiemalis]
MTIAFSSLSLKRNRSTSTTSKFNAIINKITSPFQGSTAATATTNHKKRRQNENSNRRSSLSLFFIDYFRTTEDNNADHPFANDTLFEQNRYRQQKKSQQQQQQPINYTTNKPIINNQCNIYPTTTKSILLKKDPPAFTHHRHTNSSPSAIITTTNRRKKIQQHIRHYSHVSCISSSNITVNSEDLTAKEFADIAGIRILSEDELVDNDITMADEFNNLTTHTAPVKKICTFCGDNEESDIMVPSLTVSRISHNNNSSVIRSSNSSSIICPSSPEDEEEPQIWDNQFWKKPGCGDGPLHEYNAIKQENAQNTTIIKKGRFEIHISSSAATSSSLVPKKPEVVEWKRKSRPTTLKHQLTA